MLAHKIIEGVNAPLPMTPPEQLMRYHHSPMHQGGGWVKCDSVTQELTYSKLK